MILDPLKSSLAEMLGQLETFAGSCTGVVAGARGEMEGVLAGIGAEIEGIKTDINGALGPAVAQVESLDQELAALEP